VFLSVLKEHTAGDPMDEKVKRTNLTKADIAAQLAKKGFKVSRNMVKKLLKKHDYVKRKPAKSALNNYMDFFASIARLDAWKQIN
jgi:predicted alpha/beta-hydrolase family hydrolase